MTELKYCPFCGNEVVRLIKRYGVDGWRNKYYISCDYNDGGCGASSGWYHSPEEAVECWNRRNGFSPNEVAMLMVEYGQVDKDKFRWGETIKYSPFEVKNILDEELSKRVKEV